MFRALEGPIEDGLAREIVNSKEPAVYWASCVLALVWVAVNYYYQKDRALKHLRRASHGIWEKLTC